MPARLADRRHPRAARFAPARFRAVALLGRVWRRGDAGDPRRHRRGGAAPHGRAAAALVRRRTAMVRHISSGRSRSAAARAAGRELDRPFDGQAPAHRGQGGAQAPDPAVRGASLRAGLRRADPVVAAHRDGEQARAGLPRVPEPRVAGAGGGPRRRRRGGRRRCSCSSPGRSRAPRSASTWSAPRPGPDDPTGSPGEGRAIPRSRSALPALGTGCRTPQAAGRPHPEDVGCAPARRSLRRSPASTPAHGRD